MAFNFVHLFIGGGIIVSAVGDELVLAHPDHADGRAIAAIVGGPALYLFGNALFKWVTNDRRWPPLSHMAGVALMLALLVPSTMHLLSALALAALVALILVLVAAWESLTLRRAPREH